MYRINENIKNNNFASSRLKFKILKDSNKLGFTLIEVLVAITILSLVTTISWRGFDQIIRGREIIVRHMDDKRNLSHLFNQIYIDSYLTASDHELMLSPILVKKNYFQIIRTLKSFNIKPCLQVVRYYLINKNIIRYASYPITNMNELKNILQKKSENNSWTKTSLINNVDSIIMYMFVRKKNKIILINPLKNSFIFKKNNLLNNFRNIPLNRTIAGIKINIKIFSKKYPISRVFLVGE